MIARNIKRFQVILVTIFFLSFSLMLMSENIRGEGGDKVSRRLIMSVATLIQRPLSFTAQTIKDIWGGYVFLIGLSKENEVLMRKVATLTDENIALRELSMENVRLKEYLKMVESSPHPRMVARVIGYNFTGWQNILVIDKGEDDGIEKNMAVVCPEGVVGRIINVFPNASQVLLILDHNSSIDAVVQRNRVRAIVGGRGNNDELTLRFVSKESDIKLGDTVVSSGLGGIFPKGLLVGKVVNIKDGERGFFKDVRLSPIVDFLKLEEVQIIKSDSVAMLSKMK